MRKIVFFVFVVILVVAVGTVGWSLYDQRCKYPDVVQKAPIPRYESVDFGMSRIFSGRKDLPFACAAVIDVDGDGRDEIFLGGGKRQADALYRLQDGHGSRPSRLVDISDQYGLTKVGGGVTTGVAVIDIDGNGYSDLLVSHEHGLFLYKNSGTSFVQTRLDIDFAEDEVPLGAAFADLNGDGHADFFVPVLDRRMVVPWSPLLRRSPAKVSSKLFINQGDDTFVDFTKGSGIASSGGALQAAFVDLDGDGQSDLVLLGADGFLKIWQNLGNIFFERKQYAFSKRLADYMGMSFGDYNSDGRIDIVLTNRGTSIPSLVTRLAALAHAGRYGRWMLLKNSGNFTFYDDAEQMNLARYELGRGPLLVDVNGDGLEDLLVAQNHPGWLPNALPFLRLPGHVLLQQKSGGFSPLDSEDASSKNVWENPAFSVTSLVADANGDGLPDIVEVNLAGKSHLLLNRSKKSTFLKVVLPDSVQSLGAQVSIKTMSDRTIKEPYLTGSALCSSGSHAIFLGLGADKAVGVLVHYHNKEYDQATGALGATIVNFAKSEQ